MPLLAVTSDSDPLPGHSAPPPALPCQEYTQVHTRSGTENRPWVLMQPLKTFYVTLIEGEILMKGHEIRIKLLSIINEDYYNDQHC